MICYFLTLLLHSLKHSLLIIDSLISKFIFFVDLDLVNLMLLVPQQGNLLTRSLLRLPNPFQDSQKYKKLKRMSTLVKVNVGPFPVFVGVTGSYWRGKLSQFYFSLGPNSKMHF